MIERGFQPSPKLTANANNCPSRLIVTLSFGSRFINIFASGLPQGLFLSPASLPAPLQGGYPVVAYRNASLKTVPYRGGIRLLCGPPPDFSQGAPLQGLTLARLGFEMRFLSTFQALHSALGNYRLTRKKEGKKEKTTGLNL
jgi:hypothetical protein